MENKKENGPEKKEKRDALIGISTEYIIYNTDGLPMQLIFDAPL